MGISLKIVFPGTKKPLFSKKEGFKLYKISQITYWLSFCITKLLPLFPLRDANTNLYYRYRC